MLGVISHDAGGAHILSSYVARTTTECAYVLDGPACKVFENRLGRISKTGLDEAIESCDEFLCGTSWQSDLEWRAIGAAKDANKRVRVFLDHWVNFRERFVREGAEHLPDEIWVGDTMAQELACKEFSEVPIRLVPNPYFDDIRDEMAGFADQTKSAVPGKGVQVLFVCEPTSEHGVKQHGNALHWGYTEFDALRFFLTNHHAMGETIATCLIRPHPAEAPGKYDAIAEEFAPLSKLGGDKPLLEEIAGSDVVVGCASMAMVVGLISGRRVVSTIPPNCGPCALPQTEIEDLNTLINNEKQRFSERSVFSTGLITL